MLLSGLLDPATQMPRTRLFWAVLGALIFGQLMAIWLLCSHQVRKAEARQTDMQVQQLALADCLQYIPGATIATCTNRVAESGIGSQGNGTPKTATLGAPGVPAGGVMPVGFTR